MNCPNCGKSMVKRTGKFGDFMGCSAFPRCKTIVNIPKSGIVSTEKKALRRIEKLSDYQQAIENWVKNGTRHGVVKATAGSGKTRTQEHVVAVLIEDMKVSESDIIYLAFNSHVVREAVEKGLPARTTHSVGFEAVRNYVKGKVEVDENKVTDIIKNLIQGDWDNQKWMISPVSQIVSKLKNTMAPHDNATLEKICEKFGIEVNGSSTEIFDLVRQTMDKNNKQLNRIDFDDQIYLPVKFKMPVKQYPWVLGDEVQDYNRCQIELIQKISNGRTLSVGDENQCQPAGTKVKIFENGSYKDVNIEDIKVEDKVFCYSSLFGTFINSGLVIGISKREFSGKLRKIQSNSGLVHEVTPNHKCVVKWDESKISRDSHIVYLMRKNNNFRIGLTKMWSSGLGLRGRLWVEGADEAWILGVFQNRAKAEIEEAFISYRYGIPQTRFLGANHYWPGLEQEVIDAIYEKISAEVDLEERAIEVLERYNRDINYPFFKKGEKKWRTLSLKSPQFKVEAANLMPDCMLIPEVNFGQNCRTTKLYFCNFSLELKETSELVYGLEVDKHHTYVSNGILTGNSMYGFRGAAPDAMQKIQEAFNAEILPLSISYRNPISHVELINRIFPEIKHEKSPFAKQGEILSMSYDKMLGNLRDGDLVVCRNNAPLVEPVFALIRMGIKATIRGRDIGKGLIALCERFNVKSTEDLLTKLEEYRLKEVGKLLKAEKNNQAQTLTDKVDTIFALSEGCEWVWQITQKIDEVFSDKKEGIIFSTVHRAKGDEAERVFILKPQLMPSKYAKSEEELIQERNVLFVALSRSKDTLVFVGGPVPAAFESSEMWEEEDLAEQLEEIKDYGMLEEKVIEQLKEQLPEGTKLYTDVKFYENGTVEFEKEVIVPEIPKCPF